MMDKKRVVITGMGIVSPSGNSRTEFWESVSQGQSAIKPWAPEGMAAKDYPVKYAAVLQLESVLDAFKYAQSDFPPLERRGVFGYLAALQAVNDAGLTVGTIPSHLMGCIACSGVPEITQDEYEALFAIGEGYPKNLVEYQPQGCSGINNPNDSMVTSIASTLNLNGPVVNVNGACAGAAQAIGQAFKSIQRGETQMMLAGGADSVTNARVMSGLFLLGATATNSTRASQLCCPFDKARSGLVAGEGGAFLMLEERESALQRGATIYAEIKGYATTLDAYKVTAPHPEGAGAMSVMEKALGDAGVAVDQIDYINAHGTSTPMNDAIETQAIKKVFAQRLQGYPLVSSTKSMIGHWISAAAAPEAMATALALFHGLVPPTINYKQPDPNCDLDYVPNQARELSMRYALSNSFGFGGINACLVFGVAHG